MLNLAELNAYGATRWAPARKLLDKFLDLQISKPPTVPCTKEGFYKWDGVAWVEHYPMDIERLVVLDFEAKKLEEGVWRPVCCGLYGLDDTWYYWNHTEGDMVMPFPCQRVVIGQDSGRYDRRYLSGEYATADPRIIHVDTLQLATIIGGISDDKVKGLFAKWEYFDKRAQEGKGVPQWYEKCGPVNLEFLAKRYLGIKVNKEIRDAWVKDPTSLSPETLYEYCMNDVYTTALLAQVLIQRVRYFIPSDVTWYGMAKINASRYYLKDWDKFIEESEAEYLAVQERLQKMENRLVGVALEKGEEYFPLLDWKLYVRGKNKGLPKWKKVVNEAGPMSGNVTAYLLGLTWEDKQVELRKTGVGQAKWWCGDSPLPHPDGSSANLGTPLCKDMVGFAKSGRLKSTIVPQTTLIKLFALLDSCSQWKSYRTRYMETYRMPITESIDLSVADLNGTGTLSRRSTSNKWVVLPKPKENKIGSGVMKHLAAPPTLKACKSKGEDPEEWQVVSADFPGQETRIACAIFTDCRAEKHNSTPWTKAVMTGDKKFKTDAHNMTAQRFGIDRGEAKPINFQLQYQGGLNALSNSLRLIKGISRQEAEKEASDFMVWYKGENGVARPVFDALSTAAMQPNGHTYLLKVRQPNSINPAYLWDKKAFFTLRANWPIQSGGVDEKHALILLIDYYAQQQGLGKNWIFAFDCHDCEAIYVKRKHVEAFTQIFNQALENLMHIAFEAAAQFWREIDHKRVKPLTPPEVCCSFESVDVGSTYM